MLYTIIALAAGYGIIMIGCVLCACFRCVKFLKFKHRQFRNQRDLGFSPEPFELENMNSD